MVSVLVATSSGSLILHEQGERTIEMAGRAFSAVAAGPDDTCLAVVDEREIWRRAGDGVWTHVATADLALQSVTSTSGIIFGGGLNEAALIRVAPDGTTTRIPGFEACPGREEWFASGPPLGVRSLAATIEEAGMANSSVLIAAVHVGGLPCSTDQGVTWKPTIPVACDVHEVRAHPCIPHLVAAAAAVGLCVSHDSGRSWQVVCKGLELTNSLALAMLLDGVLFCTADGPFATGSQIWRWQIGSDHVTQVRGGLPHRVEGKVDTAQMSAHQDRAAIVDGAGNLWLSTAGANHWHCLAIGIPRPAGVLVLPA